MSFVIQVRLQDVPGLPAGDPGLLSFHYCQKCTEEGHGSNGWINDDDPIEATGYDMRIFEDCSKNASDGQGILAVDFMKPRTVTCVDFLEVPELGEFRNTPALEPLYAAVREKYNGLDKNDISKTHGNVQGFLHLATSKLGGWPTWFQYPEWPQDAPEERVTLIAQLEHFPDVYYEYWCNGMV